MKLTEESVVDVGAGAGFPGLPLKLACPGISLTLIDSVKKKVEFINHIINCLELKGTKAVWTRAEDFAREKRESFDLAVTRAVAELNVISEYCLPLVRVGGRFVAWKETAVEDEVDRASNAIQLLGGRLDAVRKFPGRALVIIEKTAPTPARFPRRAGMAKKRPL